VLRIRDVYPGSRFLSILDPESRIPDPKSSKRSRGKKLVALPFFVATNITKLKLSLFLNWWRKKFEPLYKELRNFLPKKLSLSSQKYGLGSGIRIKLFRIPDSGVKKAPDTDPKHWIKEAHTLILSSDWIPLPQLTKQNRGNHPFLSLSLLVFFLSLSLQEVEASVADPDPGSDAFLTLYPGSGMGKKSMSGSGMFIHISDSLRTIIWVKNLNSGFRDPESFFYPGTGSGMEKIRIRDKHPGSATLAGACLH
jgi:hypothetical protein